MEEKIRTPAVVPQKKYRAKGKKVLLMTEARPLSLGVPVFRPLPQNRQTIRTESVSVPDSQLAQRRTNVVVDLANTNNQTV